MEKDGVLTLKEFLAYDRRDMSTALAVMRVFVLPLLLLLLLVGVCYCCCSRCICSCLRCAIVVRVPVFVGVGGGLASLVAVVTDIGGAFGA